MRAFATEDAEAAAGFVDGREEGQALDVIPVRVGNEEGEIERLGLEFFQERDTELTQAGAGIEDDDVLAGADFDTGSIAAVVNGAASRSGDGAANTPKLYGRRAFDGATLAQVRGKMKLKNATEEMFMACRAVILGKVDFARVCFASRVGHCWHSFQEKVGGLAGTRTPDQCLKRALLYQLSYQSNRAQENKLKASESKVFPAHQSGWHKGDARFNLRPHAVARPIFFPRIADAAGLLPRRVHGCLGVVFLFYETG